MRRLLLILIVAFSFVSSAFAQDLFQDGRLNTDVAAPIILYCSTNNDGIEAYIPKADADASRFLLRATRAQIELALAQAINSNAPILITAGSAGSFLYAYADRTLTFTSRGRNYSTSVSATVCGTFTPNFFTANQVPAVVITTPKPNASTSSTQATPATPSTGSRTYTVQKGDNLFRIGLRFGVPYQQIATANGITDPTKISVGQVLTIP
ncbi:MAG: LysM peptidoglycan-binding domain-containing protein [Phototrophicaceae bacterium]